MFGIIFERAGEVLEIRINIADIKFRSSAYGFQFFPLNSMMIDKEGVIKDNPDLKDNPEWRYIAQERLKEKLSKMKSDEERKEYVITEMASKGWIPKQYQIQGGRVYNIK